MKESLYQERPILGRLLFCCRGQDIRKVSLRADTWESQELSRREALEDKKEHSRRSAEQRQEEVRGLSVQFSCSGVSDSATP